MFSLSKTVLIGSISTIENNWLRVKDQSILGFSVNYAYIKRIFL